MNHSTNITKQTYRITRDKRQILNGQRSAILWFTGLSGSGKSTLADLLEQALYERGIQTMHLDGDNIRFGLNKDLDFSEEGRRENIRRIAEVAKLFTDAGIVVVTAFISPFRADRDAVRALTAEEDFIEIYVDCPLEVCEARDEKGLYARARAGEIQDFTGINSPFEVPLSPEITVYTAKDSPEKCIREILAFVLPRINKKSE